MLSANKIKALAAIKRLQGLTKKVEELIETDAYCIEILRNTLALKGHIANIQAEILDSHLIFRSLCKKRRKEFFDREKNSFC